MIFIAFDVETATGARNSLCQIGYIRVKNDTIVESISYLVQPPGNEYSSRNSCIHGISALDTTDKPPFPKIWDQIKKPFKSQLLIAHNASFDIDVLTKTLQFYNLSVPRFRYECTLSMTGLKLKSLCQAFNIDIESHHDALADATACSQAYINLKKGIKPNLKLIKDEGPIDNFAGHEKITGDLLRPNLDVEDKDNPFYSKKVVLTGILDNLPREEAAKILKSKGADIDTGVTKRTKYVIVGKGAGPSKLKKVDDFNSKGSDIEILNEATFLEMIKFNR